MPQRATVPVVISPAPSPSPCASCPPPLSEFKLPIASLSQSLHPSSLITLLVTASSAADEGTRRQATAAFEGLLRLPGCRAVLTAVAVSPAFGFTENDRLSAVVQLKNSFVHNRSDTNTPASQKKFVDTNKAVELEYVRSLLATYIHQPNRRIAALVADCLALVTKNSAITAEQNNQTFTTLLAHAAAHDTRHALAGQHALNILVNALVRRCLLKDRLIFSEIAKRLTPIMTDMCKQHVAPIIHAITTGQLNNTNNNNNNVTLIQHIILLESRLHCLKRLIINGIDNISLDENVRIILQTLYLIIDNGIRFILQTNDIMNISNDILIDYPNDDDDDEINPINNIDLDKNINNQDIYKHFILLLIICWRIVLECQGRHPVHFSMFVGGYMRLAQYVVTFTIDADHSNRWHSLDGVRRRACAFVGQCMRSYAVEGNYRITVDHNQRVVNAENESAIIKEAMSSTLTNENVAALAQTIISNVMTLQPRYLQEWIERGEELHSSEQLSTPEWSAAAETLIMHLAQHFPTIVAQVWLTSMQTSISIPPSSDAAQLDALMITFESLYHVLGLTLKEINVELQKANAPIVSVITQFILPQMSQLMEYSSNNQQNERTNPAMIRSLLHRRLLLLQGDIFFSLSDRSAAEKEDKYGLIAVRRPMLESMAASFNAKFDIVVRLAAASALERSFRDIEYDHDPLIEQADAAFIQSSAGIFDSLFALIDVCSESESINLLMNCVDRMIESLRRRMSSLSSPIVARLNVLWQRNDTNNHSVVRTAIIRTLTSLTVTLQSDSVRLHSYILPLLTFALDTEHADRAYLHERAIDLYAVTLTFAPRGDRELLAPMPHLLRMLHASHLTEDFLKQVFAIIDSAILLDIQLFLSIFSKELETLFQHIHDNTGDAGFIVAVSTLHLISTLAPNMLFTVFASTVTMIHYIVVRSWIALNTEDRRTLDGLPSNALMAEYIALIARWIINDIKAYRSIIQQALTSTNNSSLFPHADALGLKCVFKSLSYYVKCVPEEYVRRLCAFALLVLASESDVISANDSPKDNVSLIKQLMEITAQSNVELLTTVERDGPIDFSSVQDDDNTEVQRRIRMTMNDPITNTPLMPTYNEAMKHLHSRLGDETMRKVHATLDDQTIYALARLR